MIKEVDCYGRVTVNSCVPSVEILYLGRTHPGNYIRIASRAGKSTQIVAEVTYPENSKLIHFQDGEIEVIEASDNSIIFKLKSILTPKCDRVNAQEVDREDPTKSE
jgi:hypothetical protein